DIEATVCVGLKFEIGETTAPNMAAAILKTDAFNLSGLTGIKIHGLIGYEFFNSFIVKINYVNQQLTIYRPNTYYIPRKGTKIPISIEERKPYIHSEIEIDSTKKILTKLILDTGAGHPISLETDNGVPFPVPPVNVAAHLGIGLSGPINGYLSRIRSLKLGKFELRDVITAFPDYIDVGAKISSIARNGNMGTSILKRFTVVFDYSRSSIYLKPTLAFKEPFEHNMSGMELISGGENYKRKFVLRVEPASPAEAAGLLKDDEIVSINFKKADEMSMEEIDALMRSKDDRSLLLEVQSKGQPRADRVILTLKRRI
ncbi:MAG TPA: PDZ domain-containing protein, partial [Sphingobacteriaceae bacterium]